jgi:hypothetical protein
MTNCVQTLALAKLKCRREPVKHNFHEIRLSKQETGRGINQGNGADRGANGSTRDLDLLSTGTAGLLFPGTGNPPFGVKSPRAFLHLSPPNFYTTGHDLSHSPLFRRFSRIGATPSVQGVLSSFSSSCTDRVVRGRALDSSSARRGSTEVLSGVFASRKSLLGIYLQLILAQVFFFRATFSTRSPRKQEK